MGKNYLKEDHLRNLQSMVGHDRFSTGPSVLDLHSRDQSHHPPSLPHAVIWPVDDHSNRRSWSDRRKEYAPFERVLRHLAV